MEFFRLIPSLSTSTRGVFRSSVRGGSVLVVNESGYDRVFHPDGHQELYDHDGRLKSWFYPEDPSRDSVLIYRDTDSTQPTYWQVSSVEDGRQRSVDFHYGTSSISGNPYQVLTSITGEHPSGSETLVQYQYDIDGNLSAVVYPDNTERQFRYGESSHLANPAVAMPRSLTSVIDENGNIQVAFGYDDHGRANWSYHAGGAGQVSEGYVSDTSVTANRATGELVQYTFQDPQNDRTFRKPVFATHIPKGHGVCAGTPCYIPAGYTERWVYGYQDSTCANQDERLCRYVDSHGVTTEYEYDDLFERVRIEGVGTPEERRIETDYDESVTFRPTQQRVYAMENGSEVLQSQESYVYDMTTDSHYLRSMLLAKCEADPKVSGATNYVCSNKTYKMPPEGVRRWIYTYCQLTDTINPNNIGCPVGDLWPRTVIDPNNNITTYGYYQSNDDSECNRHNSPGSVSGNCFHDGDLATITNALGQVTTFKKYDYRGRVVATVDANSTETDYTYTPRGWINSTVVIDNNYSPNTLATMYTYDNVGNVKTVTDPDGVTTTFTYDAANRLTDITDMLGNRIHYTLDSEGNHVGEDTYDAQNVLHHSLSRTYDALNRLSNVIEAYQRVTEVQYDANNRESNVIDPNYVWTHKDYDGLSRLKDTIQDYSTGESPAPGVPPPSTISATTQYDHDALGNIASVKDPDNLTTTYDYNGLRDLKAIHSPDTGDKSYHYDAAGNRTSTTDARGVTAQYTYDALNRLTGITYPTASLDVTYRYDEKNSQTGCHPSYPAGHLTSMTDSTGTTTNCYDRRGNVLTKRVSLNTETSGSIKYVYTPGNRLASIQYPHGDVVAYGRDDVGRINTVTFTPAGSSTSVTVVHNVSYYPFGPLETITLGNGRTLTKTYDLDYSIQRVESSDPNGLVIDSTVDALGNLTSASNAIGASPPTRRYTYDALYRLIGVRDPNGSWLEQYTYDATGDRLSKRVNGQTETYTYSDPLTSHRLVEVDGLQRLYDENGNMVSSDQPGYYDPQFHFSFDDRNRMKSFGETINCNYCPIPSSAFAYNARGERTIKDTTILNPGSSSTSAPTTNITITASSTHTVYFYDERGNLLGEFPGTSDVQPTDYIYLGSLPIAEAVNGQVYYIETDQLGTPRDVVLPGVSTAEDKVVWKRDYFGDSFGADATNEDPDGDGNYFTLNLRFPGQYYDYETNLDYNYFRDYEPRTGRYIESDPSGLDGGINTYSYVMSDPMTYFDSQGLWVKLCIRGLGGPDQPPHKYWNLASHWYLNVSGLILSFQAGSNIIRSPGRIDHDESQTKGCTTICRDPKFDRYVIAAARLEGMPTYCLGAYPGTWMYELGDRNCQTWATDVLLKAYLAYVEHEPCPDCSKGKE